MAIAENAYQPNWNNQPVLTIIDHIYDNLSNAVRFPILANRSYLDGATTITQAVQFHKHENYATLQKISGGYRAPALCVFLGLKTEGEWIEGSQTEDLMTYICIDAIFSARNHSLSERGCIAFDQNIKQAMKTIRRVGNIYINWLGFVNYPALNKDYVIRSAYEVEYTNN